MPTISLPESAVELPAKVVAKLHTISDAEMIEDYIGARQDMAACRTALGVGLHNYLSRRSNADVNVLKRLIQNCMQLAVIKSELRRRGVNLIDLGGW